MSLAKKGKPLHPALLKACRNRAKLAKGKKRDSKIGLKISKTHRERSVGPSELCKINAAKANSQRPSHRRLKIMDNLGRKYESMTECAKKLGVCVSAISQSFKRGNTVRGYKLQQIL